MKCPNSLTEELDFEICGHPSESDIETLEKLEKEQEPFADEEKKYDSYGNLDHRNQSLFAKLSMSTVTEVAHPAPPGRVPALDAVYSVGHKQYDIAPW
ncbi:MAG: hypothetical protein Q9187_005845 [Circinaria calcarea]